VTVDSTMRLAIMDLLKEATGLIKDIRDTLKEVRDEHRAETNKR
jgi:hypothetical protein